MTATGDITEFTAVDGAPEAAWFIRFMDAANAAPGYAEMRAGLAAALEPLATATVLDVGAGTGDDARELAARAHRVVGVDLSAAMVDEARRRHGAQVEFRVRDLAALDEPDGAYDAVRAKLVLMHCAGLDAAAAELVRVTRPGGRLAVFDYDFETTTVDHPDVATTREIVRCCANGHANMWSGRQLRRRFTDLGLAEVTVTPFTVLMPYALFRTTVGGRLDSAAAAGELDVSADRLAAWWADLAEADARGTFFTSLTGFLLAGTRRG